MSDKDLVEICLRELRKKTGHEDSRMLIQRDIEYLCTDIAEKTNIHISLSTIKRLLNGQFSRLPQIATLNAITYYLGYENWQDFKIRQKKSNTNGHGILNSNGHEPRNKKKIVRYSMISIVAAALLLTSILLLSNYFSIGGTGNYSSVPFSFRKTTDNDIPNTVVFNYNIDNLSGDSFFIQQSWDANRKVRIYKKNYTLTDVYYEPGFHNAKLIVNDKVIKTLGVSIPTEDWFFYSKDKTPAGVPVYIKPTQPVRNGIMGLTPEDVTNSHIDILGNRNYIYTFFPARHEVSSDNFMLSARIRMKDLNNTLCPNIMIEVGCETNFLYFHLATPGCTGFINAQFGEQKLSGKTNDLSTFGCDVQNWKNVEMMVMDKHVSVYINQKEIFTKTYSHSSGLITGLAFISNGLCEIDNVELTGLDGKVVYKNSF